MPKRLTGKTRREKQVELRLPPDEKAALQTTARGYGITFSAYLRILAIAVNCAKALTFGPANELAVKVSNSICMRGVRHEESGTRRGRAD